MSSDAGAIELVVQNRSGLHARPATLFVKAAADHAAARITVENLSRGSAAVDARSLIRVLSIGVMPGHRIRICAEGPGAEEALGALRDLVASGLGEPVEDHGGATW